MPVNLDWINLVSGSGDHPISSTEAARRLGVKIETLYAYVSRGYLTSRRRPGGASTFDRAEVEALRAAGTRRRDHSAAAFGFPSVTTAITERGRGRLRYRGVDVADLVRERSVEQVAGLLWTGTPEPIAFAASPANTAVVRALLGALPAGVDTGSRLRVAVTVAAALDASRHDLGTDAVVRAGAAAVSCLVTALERELPGADDAIATRLWVALAAPGSDVRLRDCLHAALILLADHGLAAGTVAARVAASARANPYAVISAGLAGLEGPLHGGSGAAAHRLLRDASGANDAGALADVVTGYRGEGARVPGFNESPDVRAEILLSALRDSGAADAVLGTVDALRRVADPDGTGAPSVELALGALAVAAGLPLGATATITSVARSVGWVAHALEEYRERALRWRAREVYTGP